VKIIASLRINNGLKCQRGISSICFVGDPTTTTPPKQEREKERERDSPIHVFIFKNKTETEQWSGIEGASSRFSNKFAECLSASESETNL